MSIWILSFNNYESQIIKTKLFEVGGWEGCHCKALHRYLADWKGPLVKICVEAVWVITIQLISSYLYITKSVLFKNN